MLAYATLVPINHHWRVKFPEHLAQLRKGRGFTQPQLAEKIGLHVAQIRRYEAGTSQPTLDVIRSHQSASRDLRYSSRCSGLLAGPIRNQPGCNAE